MRKFSMTIEDNAFKKNGNTIGKHCIYQKGQLESLTFNLLFTEFFL